MFISMYYVGCSFSSNENEKVDLQMRPDPLTKGYVKDSVYAYKNRIGGRRKLLDYFERKRFAGPMKSVFKKASRSKKRNTRTRNEAKDSEEVWDNWGKWSKCSVTCGTGRQVRWRHCLSDSCTKGLKKAQIKNCRRKDCEKNILNWLGIKS